MIWVRVRSEAFVYYRDLRFGGFRFANRRACGWRFGRA